MGAEIKARMSLDSSGVKAGVEQAKGHVGGFNASLKGMGGNLAKSFAAGAAVGAITLAVSAIAKLSKASFELAVKTKEMSDQTGLSVDEFQAFNAAAMTVTGGSKAAELGLVSFRQAQEEALNGNEAQIEAFKRLGVSLEDIANKSTPQLLEAVAKAYQKTGDFSSLVDIFGKKNAAKMEDALLSLADNGFGGLEASARDAGMMIGEEIPAQLDMAGDVFDRWGLKLKAGFLNIVSNGIREFKRFGAFFKSAWDGIKVVGKELWDPSVNL